jgi:hypothetical protein
LSDIDVVGSLLGGLLTQHNTTYQMKELFMDFKNIPALQHVFVKLL